MTAQTVSGRDRQILSAIWLLFAIKLVFLIVLALNTRFVMDEFWTMAQTNWLWNGYYTTIWPEKSVLYVVFYDLPRSLGKDTATIMLLARVMTAGIAIAVCALVWRMARISGHSAIMAAGSVLLLLCFSNYMERSFRLRSEPLALLFAAIALWIMMRGSADQARRLLLAGLFCGLAFLTTQKSVYYNLALGIALVTDALAIRRPGAALRRGLLLVLGWLIAVAAYVLFFGGLQPMGVLRALILGPVEVATVAGEKYPGIRGYIIQTLLRNFALYLLCFAGLGLALIRLRRLAAPLRIHAVFTLVITGLIFSHDQPWPYVFIMVLPFLAIYGPWFMRAISGRSVLARLVPVLLITGIAFSLMRNLYYLEHDNREQLAFVASAEALIPEDGSYFDGIGMVPSRRMEPRLWLDAMEVGRVRAAGPEGPLPQALRTNPPDLILLSYRTDALAPLLGSAFGQEYREAGPDLLVRKAPDDAAAVPLGEHKSVLDLFSAVYSY